MDFKDHAIKSLHGINNEDPQFLKKHWEKLSPLIWEMHFWLDAFLGRKTARGDYTGYHCMEHRQERHHLPGVELAVLKFSAKYGIEFEQIIRQEAQAHIYDDFGFMPSQDDFCPSFWREIRKERRS